MLDGVALSWLGPGSGWAVAGVFILFMALGRLVPLSTLKREVAEAKQRAEDWKEACTLERRAREIQAAKDDEILALLRGLTAPTHREPAA